MRRYLLSFVFLFLSMMPMLAYDRHGRDYSVNDGGSSSGLLGLVVVIGFVAYGYFSSDKGK